MREPGVFGGTVRRLTGIALIVVAISACADNRNDVVPRGSATVGGAVEVKCAESLPPIPEGVCQITRNGVSLRLAGTVLAPDTVFRDGEVLLDETGLIVFAGCPEHRPADLGLDLASVTEVVCPDGVISPGLINTHEHLFFSHHAPLADTGMRYDHRNDWRPQVNLAQRTDSLQVMWSELRHVMGGATSATGAGTTSLPGLGSALGFLRNLDVANAPIADDNLWNITEDAAPSIAADTFPLESPGDFVQVTGDCSQYSLFPTFGRSVYDDPDVYLPHVAEGINAAARNEFLCLTSDDRNGDDALIAPTGIIHGVALTATDGALMAEKQAALIWSPRSNIALYGDTAPVTMLKQQGVLMALGTDWAATGSSTLPRELACAASLSEKYFDDAFSDVELWRMVTLDAARMLRVEDRIGALLPGLYGDVAIYDGRGYQNPYRAIFEADASRVSLVLRRASLPLTYELVNAPYHGSIPLYGDAAIVDQWPEGPAQAFALELGRGVPACESLPVCGVEKRVCMGSETWWQLLVGSSLPPSLTGPRSPVDLAELQAANSDSQPLFSCGVPDNEPSCVPMRPGEYDGVIDRSAAGSDSDGDGIVDSGDNCRFVFNPPRVMDEGLQADADGDGMGDRCDPCPLDASC